MLFVVGRTYMNRVRYINYTSEGCNNTMPRGFQLNFVIFEKLTYKIMCSILKKVKNNSHIDNIYYLNNE